MLTETPQHIAYDKVTRRKRPFLFRLPVYAYAGALLTTAAWISSWTRIGPWSYTFFAIWFGFILVLDGVNVARSGTSYLTRSRTRFVALFLISSLFWWVFEGLNVPVQNWHYVTERYYSPLAFFLIASLNFSTVLPAVMEMAELVTSFPGLRPRLAANDPGPRLRVRTALILIAVGILMLTLPFFFPRYAFGLLWLCLIFLLDPINNLARRKSAFGHLLAGDWRFLVALPLSGVLCGFFWEMWNYFALPKWYYTVPFVDDALHLFEMPLPGYLGYLPFAVELFVMYQFALLVLRRKQDNLMF
ncbi:MAG: hypothetical protein OJF49_000573 [Ktedonobacterales bacterium]|jgi:hypothetical protein|nr:MAG: hypothetical protein OJF49_000573 [Ktedonobacterales bacterium]